MRQSACTSAITADDVSVRPVADERADTRRATCW